MNELGNKEASLSIQLDNVMNILKQTKNELALFDQLKAQNEELKKEINYLTRQLSENKATNDKFLYEEQKKFRDIEAKLTQQVETNNQKQQIIEKLQAQNEELKKQLEEKKQIKEETNSQQNKDIENEQGEDQKSKTIANQDELLENFFQNLLSKKKDINVQRNMDGEVEQEVKEDINNQQNRGIENEVLANFFQNLLSKKKDVNVQQNKD
ncbi:hypothetical protein RclHR1_15140006, partial [Rhizophagus clarus]